MAASNYDACLKKVLTYEGGYVNHPNDPGGPTNFGITLEVARRYWKADATAADVKRMPVSVAKDIYKARYWKAVNGDNLPAGVDLATFDFGVNSGPSRALRYLKTAQTAVPVDTVKRLCGARMGFLRGLRTWTTFGRGWARRVADVEATGVRMALSATGKPAEKVREDLDTERRKAERKSSNSGKGAATGTAGGATGGATAPPVDPGFDWSTLLYVGIGVATVALVGFLVYRWYINRERAKAYEAAALEMGKGDALLDQT